MRHKGLSFHLHALSFITSTKETTQQTLGGQKETSPFDSNHDLQANAEVLQALQERAAAAAVSMLVIDSAESLLAYMTGPESNAKLVVFNLSVRMPVSLLLTHHHLTNCDVAPAD